jgi:hypothetical protein
MSRNRYAKHLMAVCGALAAALSVSYSARAQPDPDQAARQDAQRRIQEVLKQREPNVKRCVDEMVFDKGGSKAEVTIRVQVNGETGQMLGEPSFNYTGDGLAPRVTTCLQMRVSNLSFPAFKVQGTLDVGMAFKYGKGSPIGGGSDEKATPRVVEKAQPDPRYTATPQDRNLSSGFNGSKLGPTPNAAAGPDSLRPGKGSGYGGQNLSPDGYKPPSTGYGGKSMSPDSYRPGKNAGYGGQALSPDGFKPGKGSGYGGQAMNPGSYTPPKGSGSGGQSLNPDGYKVQDKKP